MDPKMKSTIARMAGNILGGLLADPNVTCEDQGRRAHLVKLSVDLAEDLAAEVERRASAPTEPVYFGENRR